MPGKHPTAQELIDLADGHEPAVTRSALARHLAGCQQCQRRVAGLPPERSQRLFELLTNVAAFTADRPEAYRSAFAQAFARLERVAGDVNRGRAGAPALFQELMGHPAERWGLLVRNSVRFHSWGLAEVLLGRSKVALREDPGEAMHLANMGFEVALQLEAKKEGYPFVQDLKARAFVFIATALRLRGDLPGAEAAFLKAEAFLALGSADPLERAQLMEYEAALLRAQRRFEEAGRLLREAIRIYRRSGEPESAGRALISQAKLVGDAGQPAEAIPLLQRAAALIDPDQDPRLMLCVQQNLLVYLVDAHAAEQAAALLPQVRRLAVRSGTRTDLLRLHWLSGRVAAGLGQTDRAEISLLKAREGFLADGNGFDVALICLDLALLYLTQNRSSEARHLALHSVSYFEAVQVHREALAALVLLRAAAEQETLTLRQFEELSFGLRRALIQQPTNSEP